MRLGAVVVAIVAVTPPPVAPALVLQQLAVLHLGQIGSCGSRAAEKHDNSHGSQEHGLHYRHHGDSSDDVKEAISRCWVSSISRVITARSTAGWDYLTSVGGGAALCVLCRGIRYRAKVRGSYHGKAPIAPQCKSQ